MDSTLTNGFEGYKNSKRGRSNGRSTTVAQANHPRAITCGATNAISLQTEVFSSEGGTPIFKLVGSVLKKPTTPKVSLPFFLIPDFVNSLRLCPH